MVNERLNPEGVLAGLHQLVAEEMHLLGLELEDALGRSQVGRLEELTRALDEAARLLNEHRLAHGNAAVD